MTNEAFRKEVENIVSQIIKNYKPQKIILFGSAASERTNQDSDIDLLILKNTSRRFIDRIGEVLNRCHYKIPLEPLVYTPRELEKREKIGDPFIKEILKTGKVLYDRKS